MEAPRALLIQDVSEYVYVVKEAMQPFLSSFGGAGLQLEAVIEWIIREEIETVYHLFSENHFRYQVTSTIYDHVNNAMNGMLSIYTSEYIKAPVVFPGNRNIAIKLVKNDLYLWYYRKPYTPPQIFQLKT